MPLLPPRWRKVLQDLWSNKTRTILVVLSIAVGVFAVGSMVGARTMLTHDLTAQYLPSNDQSLSFAASGLDENFINSIAQMDGISDAQGRSVYVLRMKIGNKRSNLLLNGIKDFGDLRIDTFDQISGASVPPWRELLIERGSLGLFGVGIGDSLTVELPDGKTRALRIAGVVHDINAPPVLFANFGSAYVSFETLQWLGFPNAYTQVRARVTTQGTDRAHIQAIVDQIKARVQDSGRIWIGGTVPNNPGHHFAADQIEAMTLILEVLAVFSLFLSAFLVVNTVNALMAQQLKQIGIMKAVGARGWQIGGLYLALVFAFGAISLGVAVPLGSLGARGLTNYVGSLLNFDVLTLVTPPDVVALQVAVGLVIPVAAAIAPVVAGLRVSVREALYATGLSANVHLGPPVPGGLRYHLAELGSRVEARFGLSRPTLISLRNTFRRAGRLALTLGTLVLASSIFVSVFSVRDSLNATLGKSLKFWNYDVEVTLDRPQSADRVVREALAVPGVTGAEAWSTDTARRVRDDGSESRAIAVVAPPAGTQRLQPRLLAGRWLQPEDVDAIVISNDVVGDEPDVRVGDSLQLRLGQRLFRFSVVGVVESTLGGQIRNPRVAYMNQEGYRKVVGASRNVRTLVLATEAHDGPARLQIARALEEQFKRLQMRVDTYETLTERSDQISFQFNILIVFLLMMAGLLAVVGGLGLTGTMSMNVLERTREIGVMRAIGASDGAIRRIVITEGVLIGLISWGAGTLLAVPISRALSDAVGQAFLHQPLANTFSWTGVAIWLAAVIVLATLSSAGPAWRASSLTVREVLAYE